MVRDEWRRVEEMGGKDNQNLYIYIKAEDVAIYLPFGMYGNVFCMTRGSLVG